MLTPEEYQKKFGYPPDRDDLDRVNCLEAGKTGHFQCGICEKCVNPKFNCQCALNIREVH